MNSIDSLTKMLEDHIELHNRERLDDRQKLDQILEISSTNRKHINEINVKIEEPIKFWNDAQGFGRVGIWIGKAILFITGVSASLTGAWFAFVKVVRGE